MFSEISGGVKIALGAVGGAAATFLVFTALNHFLRIPAAEQRGRDLEGAELTAATNKAIGELANAADQARVNRGLCRGRCRVYINATGDYPSKETLSYGSGKEGARRDCHHRPPALLKATAAVEEHTATMTQQIRVGEELAKQLDHLGIEMNRMREELLIRREIERAR